MSKKCLVIVAIVACAISVACVYGIAQEVVPVIQAM